MRAASIALIAASIAIAPRAECDVRSKAHVVGGAMFATGALVTIGAVAVPLAVCRSRTETGADGRTVVHDSPCESASDATKVAWVTTLGVGLALTVFGGILYFETEPKQQQTAAIAPWVGPTGGGATFIARF